MGSGKLLLAAQKKYGIENFRKEVLFVFDSEAAMNAKEKEIVSENFCKRDDTYNLCVGGQGGFSHINSTKKNLYGKNGHKGYGGENLKPVNKQKFIDEGRWDSYCKNISSGLKKLYASGHSGHFLGKSHSEDTKRKIGNVNAEKQSGTKNSQFGSMWITNDIESRKIKSNNVIPNGWRKGRIIKT